MQISDPEGVELEYGGKKVALPAKDATATAADLEVVVGVPNPEKS